VDTFPKCPLHREWTLIYDDVETFAQPNEIHLLIDSSRFKTTMAEMIADLLERQPLIDQAGRTGMPQRMRAVMFEGEPQWL